LYEADAEEILTVIEEQDDWIDHLMLIGHNPGLTNLANYLSRSDLENVPTCGVVNLTYDVERWAEIAEANPVQVAFDYPKKSRRQRS
jgi:phosphohistidine phosphatase